MTRPLLALSFGFAALIAAMQAGHATTTSCGPRAQIIKHLQDAYAETRRAAALAANRSMVEIFASDAGTWTILATDPSGQSCMIASGEAYQDLHANLPTPGTAL